MGINESIYDALLLIMINVCSKDVASAHISVSAGEWVIKHLAEHLKLRREEQHEIEKPQRPKQTAQIESKSRSRGLK